MAQIDNLINQFPLGDSGTLSSILNLVYIILFIIFMFYSQRIQVYIMLREVGGAVERLKGMKDDARRKVVAAMKETGDPKSDPTPRIDQLIEYFTTMPISLDPAGIVPKIEHILDVRHQRFKGEVKIMLPNAEEVQVSNLEGALDITLDLNAVYKVVRHYYLLSKSTMSFYVLMQIQMQLPLVMREAEALAGAMKAFTDGQPIGDGAGALVAAKLMYKKEKKVIAEDTVMAETDLDNRKMLVLKAKGPGYSTGKTGEAIRKLIEEYNGKISMVIMVDAGGKLEGETTGETAEGVGTAIGGTGVEEFQIEDVLTKYNIPINSMVIKESLIEAISPMKKEIVDAIDVVLAKVRRLILEYTKEGDTIILAGIGNTIGIGQ
jgi:hypothetical protein